MTETVHRVVLWADTGNPNSRKQYVIEVHSDEPPTDEEMQQMHDDYIHNIINTGYYLEVRANEKSS